MARRYNRNAICSRRAMKQSHAMRIIHVITGRARRTSFLQIDNQLFVLQYRDEEIAETDVFIHDMPWREATGAKRITRIYYKAFISSFFHSFILRTSSSKLVPISTSFLPCKRSGL